MRPVILASTSPYRRALLERLGVPFEVVRPATSEEHLAREMPRDRALRLSGAKAKAVAAQRPDAVVIGSDQVASLGSRVLDKPGDADNCRTQLAALSGQTARFHTGCAVIANGERLDPPGHNLGAVPGADERRDQPLRRAGKAVRLRRRVQGGGARDHADGEHREPGSDGSDRPAADLAGQRAAQRRRTRLP